MLSFWKKYFSRPPDDKVTVCKIFKPLYYILSLLGLFPCSFKQNKSGFIVIEHSVYINATCAVSINLCMCLFLALHIRHIHTALEDNTFTEGIVTQLNYILELITLTLFCIIAYLCAYYNRMKYVQMLKTVSTHLESPICDRILRQLRFKVNVVVKGFLLIVSILQVCVNFTRQDSIWKIVLVTITFNLPQTVQFVTITFYYVLVLMIAALLNIVKQQMTSLVKQRNVDALTQVESRQRTSIREMELLYVETFEMKRGVNKAFQAPILITLIQCFHAMVSECHIIYNGVLRSRLSVHEIVNCTIWVFYQALKVYALANSGSLLNVEATRLGRLLHNIPTEKQDLRFLFEIQHFSTLMTYQGNELTVFGYFPLDSTLIFKMIASATMYLIILVQFDNKA